MHLLCRTGRVPSAVLCATAVCVARRRAAALLGTWWGWPASTGTTASTLTWRGTETSGQRQFLIFLLQRADRFFFCLTAFKWSCSKSPYRRKAVWTALHGSGPVVHSTLKSVVCFTPVPTYMMILSCVIQNKFRFSHLHHFMHENALLLL